MPIDNSQIDIIHHELQEAKDDAAFTGKGKDNKQQDYDRAMALLDGAPHSLYPSIADGCKMRAEFREIQAQVDECVNVLMQEIKDAHDPCYTVWALNKWQDEREKLVTDRSKLSTDTVLMYREVYVVRQQLLDAKAAVSNNGKNQDYNNALAMCDTLSIVPDGVDAQQAVQCVRVLAQQIAEVNDPKFTVWALTKWQKDSQKLLAERSGTAQADVASYHSLYLACRQLREAQKEGTISGATCQQALALLEGSPLSLLPADISKEARAMVGASVETLVQQIAAAQDPEFTVWALNKWQKECKQLASTREMGKVHVGSSSTIYRLRGQLQAAQSEGVFEGREQDYDSALALLEGAPLSMLPAAIGKEARTTASRCVEALVQQITEINDPRFTVWAINKWQNECNQSEMSVEAIQQSFNQQAFREDKKNMSEKKQQIVKKINGMCGAIDRAINEGRSESFKAIKTELEELKQTVIAVDTLYDDDEIIKELSIISTNLVRTDYHGEVVSKLKKINGKIVAFDNDEAVSDVDEETLSQQMDAEQYIDKNLKYIDNKIADLKEKKKAQEEQYNVNKQLKESNTYRDLIAARDFYKRKADMAKKNKNASDFNYYAKLYLQKKREVENLHEQIKINCDNEKQNNDKYNGLLTSFYEKCKKAITTIKNSPMTLDEKYKLMKDSGLLDVEIMIAKYEKAIHDKDTSTVQSLKSAINAAQKTAEAAHAFDIDNEVVDTSDYNQRNDVEDVTNKKEEEKMDEALMAEFDEGTSNSKSDFEEDDESEVSHEGNDYEEEEVDPSTHSVNTNDDDFTFEEDIKKIKV